MTATPRVKVSKLKDAAPGDLAIRFAFGAAISVVAGIVAIAWSSKAGGLFLAFPAILPATLTLIEKNESKRDAEENDEGAMLGSVAMVAFAAVGVWALDGEPSGLALVVATAAWLVVAFVLYTVMAVVHART